MEHFLSLPSTVTFCETLTSGLVALPGNAWSSFAYIIIAVWTFLHARRHNYQYVGIPITIFLVGIASFLYHATNSFWAQLLDLIAMFSLVILFILYDMERFTNIPRKKLLVWCGLLIASATLATLLAGYFLEMSLGVFFFMMFALVFYVLELQLAKKIPLTGQAFRIATGLFAGGFLFWALDVSKLWCPTSFSHLLSGHILWHITTAFTIFFAYVYFVYRESHR